MKKFKNRRKGAIGIGTLIVFIAMILVAAIAAAVIVSTVFSLRETATTVSRNAQNTITSTVNIQSIVGVRTTIGATLSSTIDYLKITITPFPSSNPVIMSDTILKFTGGTVDADLTLGQHVFRVGDPFAVALGCNTDTTVSSCYLTDGQTGTALIVAGTTNFSAEEIPGGQSNSGWDPFENSTVSQAAFQLVGTNMLTIWIDLRPGPEGINSPLTPNMTFTVKLTIPGEKIGFSKTLTTPPSYENNAVISLY